MKRLALASIALTLAAGCSKDEPVPESAFGGVTRSGKLDLELRDSAELALTARDRSLEVALTLSKGFGIAEAGERLLLLGEIEPFPEAELVLFVARGQHPALEGGPCAEQPISLALALEQRRNASYVAGSLTAYCGADVWQGTPARTPLRLSGSLPELGELHTPTAD